MLSKDGEIKITGFETVRKNWSPIAKEVQRNALEMILKEKDGVKVIKYIKGIIKQLKEHKITIDKLIIRTQLTKNIGEYVQIGPHVAVAKRMIEKGMTVGSGSTIEYVIIHGKDMIRDRARIVEEVKQKDYDSDYYIKNQVVPGMESIISVLGYKKDELLSDDSQKGLDNFI
jgi:DNA polymerase I